MKRHVVLVNPYGTPSEVLSPPLNLAYLAAFARERLPDHGFSILDFERTKPPIGEQVRQVLACRPVAVGLTALTATHAGALRLAAALKKRQPSLPILIGGVHVTAMGGEPAPEIDCAVLGEGETPFVEALSGLAAGHPLPRTLSAPTLREIDHLPAWDLLDVKAYRWFAPFQSPRQAEMFWSRGCPFDCTFCANAVWRFGSPRVRYRSPAGIVREMRLLRREYRVREVYVFDDELNTNPAWLHSVLDEILRQGVRLQWKCQMRASRSLVTAELLDKMRRAGCWQIAWGLESGDDQVLRSIRKMVTVEEIDRSLSLSHQAGMVNQGLFMLGNLWLGEDGWPEGESEEQVRRTIDLAGQFRDRGLLDYVQFNVATPFPGSTMFQIVREHGLGISGESGSTSERGMDTHSLLFRHPRLSESQVTALHQLAWQAFTLDFRLLWRHLGRIRRFSQVWGLLRSAQVALRTILVGRPRGKAG